MESITNTGKNKQREERTAFFKRVSELIHADPTLTAEDITGDQVIRSIGIQDDDWCIDAIQKQLERTRRSRRDVNDSQDEDEDEEDIPACEENELLLDTPYLKERGVFLFRKTVHPYRTRMVTSEFSIVY